MTPVTTAQLSDQAIRAARSVVFFRSAARQAPPWYKRSYAEQRRSYEDVVIDCARRIETALRFGVLS